MYLLHVYLYQFLFSLLEASRRQGLCRFGSPVSAAPTHYCGCSQTFVDACRAANAAYFTRSLLWSRVRYVLQFPWD